MNTLLLLLTLGLSALVLSKCVCVLYHLKWKDSAMPHWRFVLIGGGNILMATAAFQASAHAIENRLPTLAIIFLMAVAINLYVERRR